MHDIDSSDMHYTFKQKEAGIENTDLSSLIVHTFLYVPRSDNKVVLNFHWDVTVDRLTTSHGLICLSESKQKQLFHNS